MTSEARTTGPIGGEVAREAAPPQQAFWARTWFWAALAGIFTIPFLVAQVPPLVDFPSHLARYHVMLELADTAQLQRFYSFEWMLVGNLGADLLVYPLGALIGAEPAGCIVAASIPPLTLLSILAASRAVHGEVQATTLLALGLVYSPPLLWGFLNYSLSIALALFAFALWVKWRWRYRSAVFAALGALVWLCHASGWGVLGLLIGGYELQRTRTIVASARNTAPLAVPLLFMLLSPTPGGTAAAYTLAYKASIYLQVMRDREILFDLACAAGLLIFVIAAVATRRASFNPALGVPAALVLLFSLVIPRGFFGGDLADFRLVPVGAMLTLMALRWHGPPWTALAALAFAGARLAVTTAGWHEDDKAFERHLTALDLVPQGSRVLTLVTHRRDGSEPHPRDYSHFGSYAVVRRDAFTNTNFGVPGLHMLGVRTVGRYRADPSQHVMVGNGPGGLQDILASLPRAEFDFVWVLGKWDPLGVHRGYTILYEDDATALLRVELSPFRTGQMPGR